MAANFLSTGFGFVPNWYHCTCRYSVADIRYQRVLTAAQASLLLRLSDSQAHTLLIATRRCCATRTRTRSQMLRSTFSLALAASCLPRVSSTVACLHSCSARRALRLPLWDRHCHRCVHVCVRACVCVCVCVCVFVCFVLTLRLRCSKTVFMNAS